MKVLIISDTHGRHGNLDKVLEVEKPLDALIHLGDVEHGQDYIEAVADCTTYIVNGNNDYMPMYPNQMEVTIGNMKALICHGHMYYVHLNTKRLVLEAKKRGCNVAMFGHIHKPVLQEENGVTVLNPGSLSYPRQVGREPSYMVMTVDSSGGYEFTIKYVQ